MQQIFILIYTKNNLKRLTGYCNNIIYNIIHNNIIYTLQMLRLFAEAPVLYTPSVYIT